MKKILLIGLPILLLSSCSKQPTCDGADVKKVLFEIIKDKMKKEIKKDYFNANYNYSDVRQYARDNNLNFTEVNNEMKSDFESKASAYALAETIKATLKLNGSRLKSVDEKLKKCECASELIVNNDNKIDIEYTAQYTEDGQVYVELSY